MIYFTSDLHMGHENIIKYCNRPFRDANEMDRVLIENICQTVGPSDTLYVLGDFCFDPRRFEAWNCYLQVFIEDIIYVKGNHDPKARQDPLALSLKYNKHRYYLCHYPWASWRPRTIMLHGHCHGHAPDPNRDPRQQNRFDVGVDCWDFRPVSIDEIEARCIWPPRQERERE